jgi:hypothetical protein
MFLISFAELSDKNLLVTVLLRLVVRSGTALIHDNSRQNFFPHLRAVSNCERNRCRCKTNNASMITQNLTNVEAGQYK